MKGVLLAGGSGSRLAPTTYGVNKHLLPVYDKPMIYYPLSVLMLADIREILIVTTQRDLSSFQQLLGSGEALGLKLDYAVQDEATGVAAAFQLAKPFLNGESVCLILGDNLFYGQGFTGMLEAARAQMVGAAVFAYPVNDVSQFGAITLSKNGAIESLVEKPKQTLTGLAVTGLYFFDEEAAQIAAQLKPSERGETEIIDLLKHYHEQNRLTVHQLGRGFTWRDMGTSDALLNTAGFIKVLEEQQGFKVACLEEIAFQKKWIDSEILQQRAMQLQGSQYGTYLSMLSEQAQGGKSR